MHRETKDSHVKIIVTGFVAILVIILGIVLLGGNGNSKPEAVAMPASAQQVAAQLNCSKFTDLGSSTVGGVLDSGSCWIGGKKYAINTFISKDVRNQWLQAAEPLGVNPKWETDTSVTYPSVA